MKRNNQKTFIVCLLLSMALMLVGCGSESVARDDEIVEDESVARDDEIVEDESAARNDEIVEDESTSTLEDSDATAVELTDTIRWFNASYAVLTELNGFDYNRFAGLPVTRANRQMQIAALEEWWGVTDRASADETLDWILTEGHRVGFAEDMEFMQQIGLGEAEDRESFILANFDVTYDEAQMYLNGYEMYEQYGSSAIDAWDYCRALNLMSFYYLAGYYSEQEALDKSLEIAQMVQPMFESWDDLVASYMRGYEYWAQESSAERQAIYEDIKTRDDNPYQVDFKMSLQKTW